MTGHDQLSAMSLADDPRTFFLTGEIIDPAVNDQINFVHVSPHAFDVLEIWTFAEGAGCDANLEIDGDVVAFDDSGANGIPIDTGNTKLSDVISSIFTVPEDGALVLDVTVVDTGCTKLSVQVNCRRLILAAATLP